MVIRTDHDRDRFIASLRSKELPVEVKVKDYKDTRSNEANRKMWAMLADVSKCVNWHGRRLTSEEWKTVFTAALKRQEVIPGIEGGFVVLGTSTRKMTIAEMSELIELMMCFGTQHGVRWSDPADILNTEPPQ